ncbi:hypothetical protein FF38_02176 [Lucilia cuprina]|uniref:Uncharacterized protein n=1 Tax=Lucilia cuprina TaxID=7375 RepID=A0A0L0BW02_LUCCU|nr:hypothetical protein FF38_02176 [Lucilia cuprina]
MASLAFKGPSRLATGVVVIESAVEEAVLLLATTSASIVLGEAAALLPLALAAFIFNFNGCLRFEADVSLLTTRGLLFTAKSLTHTDLTGISSYSSGLRKFVEIGPSSDNPLCMVGRCFCANNGGRVDNMGDLLGPLKEDVRLKLEDLAKVGVFCVCCGICDVVIRLGVVLLVLFGVDELSISDVDILLMLLLLLLLLLFGVAGKLGSCGVWGVVDISAEPIDFNCGADITPQSFNVSLGKGRTAFMGKLFEQLTVCLRTFLRFVGQILRDLRRSEVSLLGVVGAVLDSWAGGGVPRRGNLKAFGVLGVPGLSFKCLLWDFVLRLMGESNSAELSSSTLESRLHCRYHDHNQDTFFLSSASFHMIWVWAHFF